MLQIKPDKEFYRGLRIISKFPVRTRVMGRALLSAVGKRLVHEVRRLIRPKFWWQKAYKASVRASYAVERNQDLVAVYADQPRVVRALDADRMLVYFRPESVRGMEQIADLFREYQPWTIDQLPRINKSYGARPYVRMASLRAVAARRRELRAERKEILEKLKALKVVVRPGSPKLAGNTAFDLEHAVLSGEFHRGGGKPVWRTVARRVPKMVVRESLGVEGILTTERNPGSGFLGLRKLNEAYLLSIEQFQEKLFGRPSPAYR
jgi:hypothetical protein